MSETTKAVEVCALTKQFGSFTAVDHVSFEVQSGEVFGCLGANGAGKTTLMRMLTTLIVPSSGTARICGHDVTLDADKVRRCIGMIPQAATSDLDLTGYENLDIHGRYYEVPSAERKKRIAFLLEMVGLTSRARQLVRGYSGGMRRRLELARALVHKPKILFLDEPSAALDPQSRRAMWDLLRLIREEEGTSIFLMTHYMEEADALCSNIAIVNAGKVVVLGSPDALKRQIPGNDIISLMIGDDVGKLAQEARSLPSVRNIHVEEDTLRVYVDSGPAALPSLMDVARTVGCKILSASVHERSLEDVFIHFTGKSIRDTEATRERSSMTGTHRTQRA